ncbi:Shikimate, quinate/shikimate dehydrogenase [Syntrophomonas zehnderi OL-4]|uniref:Shikimate dehydrogenase (NADP(+)) n=1 Tax=Syntrophomonas zehnderi OL-4 TaxID=690567 RepID=A0A0E4C8J2_9FIRM|nr:shikimate dehydrogenase [Syntrophomonas zehnderi]CFX48459.1 Shikimate, quinate/shikimate dehydrogenase [Syntrophomonas zehnderi OL-4]
MDNQHRILLGLFGNPVEHSLSPLMQNSAIAKMDLPYAYLPFKIEKTDLEDAVASIRVLHMGGVNVTIPFKERVIPFLDDLSSSARFCGAVNVIKNDKGRLIGFNTDGQGFIRSLSDEGITPQGRIVFIGAGGAARALAHEISLLNVEQLVFLDVDETKACNLALNVQNTANCTAIGQAMRDDVFQELSAKADIIINCTAVGMFPKTDDCPVVSLDNCRKDTLICDLIYNPLKTRFLSMAQEKGLKTLGGLPMLVHQGALSLEILCACSAPVAYMKEVVYDYCAKQERLHPD